jgi:hypothetical protein
VIATIYSARDGTTGKLEVARALLAVQNFENETRKSVN